MEKQIDETTTGSSPISQDDTLTFDELGIETTVKKAITDLGFKTPTPIQKEAIPLLCENNHDLIGLAQTGTGKTAAFGLPLVQKVNADTNKTKVLILSPTRELCIQISKDLSNFAKYKPGLRIVPIYGGASIDAQFKELKRGAQIIAATPGRMLDMIKRGKADISQIETLVLDEADEMLNMGFKDELDSILETTPSTKRTLLFSATMSRDVERIAKNFMHEPIEITVGKKNIGAENINHMYYMVHARDRYLALKRIADFNPNIYSIIFCRTRIETQDVADKLMSDGYNADSLHGDLSQAQRDTVMQKFRVRNLQMLVATDVAARGLDVEGLTHIINYNLPDDPEQYTHRSGRTGRAGKTGTSIAIINLKEKHKIRNIEKVIGKKFTHQRIPNGREICEKQLFNHIDRMENVDVFNEEIESFLPTIFKKLEWLDREEIIKRFVSIEFNYFLDYYKNTVDLNIDSSSKRVAGEMSRFFINLGRKDELTPPSLIGLINDISKRLSIRIGKIDIMHSFSFFEADSNFKDTIIKNFNKMKFKGRTIAVEVAEPSKGGGFKDKGKKFKGKGKDFSDKGKSFTDKDGKKKKKKKRDVDATGAVKEKPKKKNRGR
ncbi:MAG: DEAD/DEAH box helicase [bacterium]|nr:DEAD/DEAH box helicase [bacterium]